MKLLEPYRVLDLTDVRGQIAGFMLGELGADVIRVEPPGGSAARRVGPFLEEGPETERSLSFAAYNRNKRSIELDFDSETDRRIFLELVAGADFVIDSGPPSLLDEAGLGFVRLLETNERLVHVRITPFGSDGPRAGTPASDLTLAALGGPMSLQGEPDRPPVRVSVPQVWRHAGAEAAVASLIGHARMRTTGRGVFIDVSAQSAMTWTMLNGQTAHAIQGRDYEREGATLQIGPVGLPLVHECRDGHVAALVLGALFKKLLPWMLEAGTIDEAWVAREDWDTYDYRVFRGGDFAVPLDELIEIVRRFFRTRTKRELFLPGLEIGATIAPVLTLDDLLDFEQLADREYFIDLELPSGSRARVPGPFARLANEAPEIPRRAPRLDEHANEILAGLDREPRDRLALHADEERRSLPLEGLKVADFSWVGVGPISGKYLADHGANVIRIESATRADGLRTAGPYLNDESGWNRSHFFGEFNTSKRSLALDLKHERASEVTHHLLAWADVVLESFTPGAADRVGIGYEAASRINPGIILVSTCLMGQSGRCAGMAGYGYHAAGVAGFFELTGWPDRAPAGPWNAYTDTIAPRFLTTTLLAAIDHRRRTGEGQHIDLAQMEASLHLLAPELLASQLTPTRFTRNGNRALDAAPQGVYPCAGDDQWCAIAIENDEQWKALCVVLDDPRWSRDPRYEGVSGRLAAQDVIDEGLAAWTRDREPEEVMESLVAAGIPAGIVQRSRDLLNDPQYLHRRFHRWLDHAEMGRIPYSGHQFRISGYDSGPRSAAPLLGGDSFEILSEELGFEAEAIADLMAAGAIN
ncbi:MAG TPA: CoA transferase [Deltaproteobacteria bacterium]|nr:CoA transferase [Deltaproteobacteria bacterium]